jgi:hypothetical protein
MARLGGLPLPVVLPFIVICVAPNYRGSGWFVLLAIVLSLVAIGIGARLMQWLWRPFCEAQKEARREQAEPSEGPHELRPQRGRRAPRRGPSDAAPASDFLTTRAENGAPSVNPTRRSTARARRCGRAGGSARRGRDPRNCADRYVAFPRSLTTAMMSTAGDRWIWGSRAKRRS